MEERVYGAAVVAAVFRRPDGRIFFVKRKGRENLTFPTGHMKPVDRALGRTLIRESQEEVLGQNGNGGVKVKEILDVFIRSGKDGAEPKIITLYLCDVEEETAQKMIYEESGETLFVWLDPLLAPQLPFDNPVKGIIEEKVNFPLDELAEGGLKIYNERYPLQKEEGKMLKWGEKFLGVFRLIFRKT